MKTTVVLLAAFSAALFTSSAHSAEGDLSIWGGGDPATSAYSGVYVPRVQEVLSKNALSGYSWGGVSAGTADNVEKVKAHPTNLALGQWDLLSQYPDPKPFTVIAQNIGPECLYVVAAAKLEGYNTWGDVIGNAWQMDVATGTELSGSYGTWKILQSIYPDLADDQMNTPTQKLEGGADAIVQAVIDGKATHGFFVQRPDPKSPVFEKIAKANLHFVPVVDYGLEGRYEFQSLKVANGGFFGGAKSVNTACTSVALFTGDPAAVTGGQQKRLKATIDRLSKVPVEELKPNLATWRDMWDNITSITGQTAVDMMEASKKALEDVVKDATKG